MKRFLFSPTFISLLLGTLLVVAVVASARGDWLTLARIGTRFSEGDPNGSEGYDGQFVYYIARDPNTARVAPLLDEPAYRYQRILSPLLARLLSLGNVRAIPVILGLIGGLSLASGVWAMEQLFTAWGVSRWYALVYGTWAGFLLALVVDLPEPLAYGLVAGGLLALEKGRKLLGWCLFGLSLFAKEVTILFVGAGILVYLFQRRWRAAVGMGSVTIVPFGLFQLWLWITFGQPGIGSGGAMATPFEMIPFMGLLRIGEASLVYLLVMLVVFGPTIVLPAVWGAWQSMRFWLAGERTVIAAALFINTLMIAFTPFSTFRETGGILRYASGLMLAVLLFAGRYHQRRALNYSLFWVVLNAILLKSLG
jgi:hypothetical protein